jgi:hypothetical protein
MNVSHVRTRQFHFLSVLHVLSSMSYGNLPLASGITGVDSSHVRLFFVAEHVGALARTA